MSSIGFGRGFLTDIWHFAALASEVPRGRLKRIEIAGEAIVLGRTRAGEVFALTDVCPHRAAPLSAGRLAREADGRESLECAYHGWRFTPAGACAAIPSLAAGQAMDVGRIGVRAWPAAESQGLIFVWLASAKSAVPDRPPPRFPGVVGGKPKLVLTADLAAHLDHAAIGLMDPAHGPFVHAQWWWRARRSLHEKEKRFEPRDEGFAMVRHPPSANSRAYRLLGLEPTTEITFRLPAFRFEHVEAGNRQALFLTCLTPRGPERTRLTQIVWSDIALFTLAKPLIAAAARRFIAQDAEMIELQRPGLAGNPALLFIDDADTQAKWYVALKREWAASRREGRGFVNPVAARSLRWVS